MNDIILNFVYKNFYIGKYEVLVCTLFITSLVLWGNVINTDDKKIINYILYCNPLIRLALNCGVPEVYMMRLKVEIKNFITDCKHK